MAKIFYLLKQNKNQGSKIFGKWFAHGKTIETLNTRKMATSPQPFPLPTLSFRA